MDERPVALTIAGSDSGGGAGIQADLRVFSALGAFGTSAITALTAQSLHGVDGVHGVPADFVETQIRTVMRDFDVRAVKTGMLWSADIVRRVAALVPELALDRLVVDPVMVATSGARLVATGAVEAYRADLCPRARLVTPNLDEAAVFLDVARIDAPDMTGAARALERMFRTSVLLKGGHLDGEPLDVLACGGEVHTFGHPRRVGTSTHGTGCMLSAAVAAHLAQGLALEAAVQAGVAFVDRVLVAHAASGVAETLPPLASI